MSKKHIIGTQLPPLVSCTHGGSTARRNHKLYHKKKNTARGLQIYGTWNRPANNGGFMIQFRVRVVSAQVSSSVSCRSPHPHCQPIFSQWFCSCFWFLCQADGDVVTVLRASARFFPFFCWKYILQQLELTSGKGARWPYVFFFLHQAIGTHVAGKGLAWNHVARQTCWKSVSLGWAMKKSKRQRYKII